MTQDRRVRVGATSVRWHKLLEINDIIIIIIIRT